MHSPRYSLLAPPPSATLLCNPQSPTRLLSQIQGRHSKLFPTPSGCPCQKHLLVQFSAPYRALYLVPRTLLRRARPLHNTFCAQRIPPVSPEGGLTSQSSRKWAKMEEPEKVPPSTLDFVPRPFALFGLYGVGQTSTSFVPAHLAASFAQLTPLLVKRLSRTPPPPSSSFAANPLTLELALPSHLSFLLHPPAALL